MQGIKTRSALAGGGATATEASKMLEAALQQMDGIISSATGVVGVGNVQSSATGSGSSQLITKTAALALNEHNFISAANVLATAKTLALALQQVGVAAPAPEPQIGAIISDWLETHIPRQDADERLRRLQRDKESLALQFQLLVESDSAKTAKIIELERTLNERTQQLSNKEELLQRQMLSHSTLKTQKLELMSALSELKLHRAALERENIELKGVEELAQLDCQATKTPPKRIPYGSVGCLNQNTTPKTPPATLRHQILPQFHSLPRTHVVKNNNNNNSTKSNHNNNNNNNNKHCRNVAFASHERILIDDANSLSSPNCIGGGNEIMYDSFMSQTNSTPSPNLRERSASKMRNIFGKLRRSNSGNLELPTLEQAEPEFKRGVAGRATAGGRIEWKTQLSNASSISTAAASKAYEDWAPQEVCNWLCDLGLGCYADECRKWLKANPSICFFSASPLDINRELGLKTTLHRKKIQLAVAELTGQEDDILALKAAKLDVSWVLRWLDDIGLPQYKDTFLQAKVDGRMLHRLTLAELAQLQVNSCLHIASLRRGIQCMREMHWQPEGLIRRSTSATTTIEKTRSTQSSEEDDDEDEGCPETSKSTTEDSDCVALWTAHRVMEWLRVADLSEYAPNLRGAGVHGALMYYEPRFNANLLADLLSIPPSKTLLRRHLATHFKELLGRACIQSKRDAESSLGYQPLTVSAKLKPPKKTQFSLKRRKSSKGVGDVEWTDYVCPMSNNESMEEKPQQQNSNNTSCSNSSSSTNNSSLLATH